MEKLRWGVLSTAKIGLRQVIPGLQESAHCRVTAIASRQAGKAETAAYGLDIPKAYGSYEELLNDPDIDIVYNPLPNHMHVEWSIRAMEAGKHVLCEKPLGLSVEEVEEMIRVRDRCGVKAGEAFMVRSSHQWKGVRDFVQQGETGSLRLVQGAFCYHNTNPENIRNIPAYGGGGIWDIGCYGVFISRFLFKEEPLKVVAEVEYDPEMGTDRLASFIMVFPSGQAVFSSSTQLVPYQRVQIMGTRGHIEVEIPFNAPKDKPCRVFLDRGTPNPGEIRSVEYPTADQYGLMGDDFSKAVAENGEVPVSLEDALLNTRVITAIYESGKKGAWVAL